MPIWRRAVRRLTARPSEVRRLSGWFHDVLGDAERLWLTLVGSVPPHALRRWAYRRAGAQIDPAFTDPMNKPLDPLSVAPPRRIQREESAGFDRRVIDYIHNAAASGLYEIRGLGAKRHLPSFDDLVFLAGSASRYPLEGYRERCTTRTVLGTRFARKPVELDIPITFAGMSFGSLSARVKQALGRAATELGTSTTTGDGGMTPEERESSKTLVYQCLPSRYGFNPDDVRRADAIELVIGQGAKPGGGGMLLGQKVNPRVAKMRTLPEGIDQRSACRHPDWTGPDDLVIKLNELREITDWQIPIYVKIGATRVYHDVKLAVHAGADVVVVDGMQGGTAATQTVFIENVGIPTLAALRQAVEALEEMDMRGKVQLVISGGIRTGADVAKALAMGADAVSVGQGRAHRDGLQPRQLVRRWRAALG